LGLDNFDEEVAFLSAGLVNSYQYVAFILSGFEQYLIW
jgi:hypothetical protein